MAIENLLSLGMVGRELFERQDTKTVCLAEQPNFDSPDPQIKKTATYILFSGIPELDECQNVDCNRNSNILESWVNGPPGSGINVVLDINELGLGELKIKKYGGKYNEKNSLYVISKKQ
jgi:hypothetical protein